MWEMKEAIPRRHYRLSRGSGVVMKHYGKKWQSTQKDEHAHLMSILYRHHGTVGEQ